MKKVSIAFLGNAFKDSRVMNLMASLQSEGCDVRVISFDWFDPGFRSNRKNIEVIKLRKRKFSISFYLAFVVHLIRHYRKFKYDIYIAEDVYTLPFASMFAKSNSAKLYYNSRELYPFLAGLRNRSKIQKIIAKIESRYIRKCDYVMATGEMDADFLMEFYGLKKVYVLRNLPLRRDEINKVDLREKYNISNDDMIIIYQGVLLEGRGISLMIKSLKHVEHAVFVVIGEGVYKDKFKEEAAEAGVEQRVIFTGSVNHDELLDYTASADLGIALIENISKSYYYALPNKLFEYIMSNVPVIVSDLPQMKKIVELYKVGVAVDISHDAGSIISAINKLMNDKELYSRLKENCREASKELNWQSEFDGIKQELFPDLF